MKSYLNKWVLANIEGYIGDILAEPEMYPDPNVRDVWAVKGKTMNGEVVSFLVHPNGEVEEVTFKTWPPKVHQMFK